MEQSEEIREAIKSVEKSTAADWIALITRGGTGAIQVVGGIVGEVISEFIPNQRQDRIVQLIIKLSEKIQNQNMDMIRTRLHDPYHIDIFEDACYQTIRALTEERINYIANALANSLTNEDLEHLQKKKLLWLLGELNDYEIIHLFLYSYSSNPELQREYHEKHKDVLSLTPITNETPKNEAEKIIVSRTYKDRLVQLGLIAPVFKKPKKGEFPEFDSKT
ncbi:MAG: hypothetical protein SVR94_14840, partial [Pseudomonadota bacterium]|nr:hypothetical protein [Pseudomonadota bacterium]